MNPSLIPRSARYRLAQELSQSVQKVGHLLGHALLPQDCVLCGLPSGETPVCAACACDFPRLAALQCTRCALPLATNALGASMTCPDCAHHTPAFDAATAVWSYGFPIDTLIRDFKYGHHLYLGGFFGQHLAQTLQQQWYENPDLSPPDLILPMPLHPHRLKTRGFNQAAEIARHVAKYLGLAWRSDVLRRLQDTAPQAGLRREARWANLRGAFACPESLNGAHVLLIDDVLTTGASLSACAEVLRHAGSRRIDVAVLARTPEPGHA